LSGVIAATPEETLKSYLEWRVLSAYAPLLSKRFVDEDFSSTARNCAAYRKISHAGNVV
jgi:predicted metalloendopeptidase